MSVPFPAGLEEKYRILDVRAGGSSVVYRAEEISLGREVAIKVPGPAVQADPQRLQRFVEEARRLAMFNEENVLTLYDFRETSPEGVPYLVTEWMDHTLGDVIERDPLRIDAAVRILLGVLRGVHALHERSVVHRDLKPHNIFLSADATRVKVGDLGIASQVGEEVTQRLTPRYMAPELCRSDARVDRRSDIYSLGILAYEMLVGPERFRQAFPDIYAAGSETTRPARWLNWHLDPERSAAPPCQVAPELPEGLSELVTRMIAKDPADRFPSAQAVLQELSGLDLTPVAPGEQLKPISLDETEDPEASRDGRRPRTRRVWLWAAAIVVAGLCLGATMLPGSGSRSAAERAGRAMATARQTALDSGAQEAGSGYADGQARRELGNQAFQESRYDEASRHFLEARRLFERAAGGEAPAPPPADPEPSDRVGFGMGSRGDEIEDALSLCRAHRPDCQESWYEAETYREVELTPFEGSPFEVTYRAFAEFVEATGHRTVAEERGYSHVWVGVVSVRASGHSWRAPEGPGSSHTDRLDHPVVHVSWSDANAYCSWRQMRLPTEAEWEYLARGSARRVFPWGGEWDSDLAHWSPEPVATTQPVGSFPLGATEAGLHDLAGSVWEWTSSTEGEAVPLKGGSWREKNPANLRGAARRLERIDVSHSDDGFRCVRDLANWPKEERS